MKNIFKSLAAFQQEVPTIHKSTQGYGYTYANLSSIFDVINPLLKKHGLGFTQLVGENNIKTIIFHIESGEVIETTTNIPQNVVLKGMNEYQVLGSAITYIRRYAISSCLGLITDKDIDACGEQTQPEKVVAPVVAPKPKVKQSEIDNAIALLNKCLTLEKTQSTYLGFSDELKKEDSVKLKAGDMKKLLTK